jgi:hypothetical protein
MLKLKHHQLADQAFLLLVKKRRDHAQKAAGSRFSTGNRSNRADKKKNSIT